jgi:hypothetical protein
VESVGMSMQKAASRPAWTPVFSTETAGFDRAAVLLSPTFRGEERISQFSMVRYCIGAAVSTRIMAIETYVNAEETGHETKTIHRDQRCQLSGGQTQP